MSGPRTPVTRSGLTGICSTVWRSHASICASMPGTTPAGPCREPLAACIRSGVSSSPSRSRAAARSRPTARTLFRAMRQSAVPPRDEAEPGPPRTTSSTSSSSPSPRGGSEGATFANDAGAPYRAPPLGPGVPPSRPAPRELGGVSRGSSTKGTFPTPAKSLSSPRRSEGLTPLPWRLRGVPLLEASISRRRSLAVVTSNPRMRSAEGDSDPSRGRGNAEDGDANRSRDAADAPASTTSSRSGIDPARPPRRRPPSTRPRAADANAEAFVETRRARGPRCRRHRATAEA